MKPFQFRLQAVLTLREHAEQVAQRQCARAYAVVENAAARVRADEGEIEAVEQAHRAQLATFSRASEVEQLRLYAVSLHHRLKQSARELAEARRRADETWRQLLLATQRREALERLRNRQNRAHDYLSAHAEQRMLDELVGRRQGSLISKVAGGDEVGPWTRDFGLRTLNSGLF